MTKKTKRGRPVKYDWKSISRKWRSLRNSQIAEKLGCTQAAVSQKRTALMKTFAAKHPDKPNYYAHPKRKKTSK